MEKEEFIDPVKDKRKTQFDLKTAFLHQLQSSAFEFLEPTKTAKDNLTAEENEAFERLSKDKTITLTKADKGNAVIIQDVNDYREKITSLLESNGKF